MDRAECPYCKTENPVDEAPAGGVIDCAHCGRSFALAGAELGPHPSEPLPLDERRRTLLQRDTPADVALPTTGLMAVAVTAVFYGAVVLPLRETYFGELWADRGWIPYVIALLSAWAGVVLVMKWRRLSGQDHSLEFDLLPTQIADTITPENTHVFVSYLRNLPGGRRSNFLLSRVQHSLQHFRARRSVQEVVDQLRIQAEADADAVDSSFTLLRVFIWAIPILGFIGTVMGIGAAVGGFSEAVGGAADLGVLKSSLGSVTTGLGVAFDTTLLALVMSIFIMFPTSFLQRSEEKYLAAVEAYCNEHLVRRLDDCEGDGDTALLERQVEVMNRLADAIGDLEQRFSKLEGSRRPGHLRET